MNLLNKCTTKEIKLLENIGLNINIKNIQIYHKILTNKIYDYIIKL